MENPIHTSPIKKHPPSGLEDEYKYKDCKGHDEPHEDAGGDDGAEWIFVGILLFVLVLMCIPSP